MISARNGDGIDVDQQGRGDVHVISHATINSGTTLNTLLDGIDVNAFGTGNITIENHGAIGTAGDRAQATAINAAINNLTAAGNVSVTGTGNIFAVNEGIDVSANGSGSAFLDYDGNVDTSAGPAIQIDTKSGTITATTSGTIKAAGHAHRHHLDHRPPNHHDRWRGERRARWRQRHCDLGHDHHQRQRQPHRRR